MHKSVRIDNYGEPYGPGDVVGCHIALFEDPSLNRMSFYRNGVDQGVAYSGADIPPGIYFPAVSLYMKVCFDKRSANIIFIPLCITNYLVTLITIDIRGFSSAFISEICTRLYDSIG